MTTTASATTTGTARFKTILSARSNNVRPSDLELLLRSHCRTIKVVESLAGGAHLLIPGVVGGSLAIRVYFPSDLEARTEGSTFGQSIATFLESYQLAVLLFILPADGPDRQEQLAHEDSPLHQAQRQVRENTFRSERAARAAGKYKSVSRMEK